MRLLIVFIIVIVFSVISDLIIKAIKRYKDKRKGGSENDRIS